jgi:outer membrane protein
MNEKKPQRVAPGLAVWVVLAGLLGTTVAQAQSAGSIIVRAGATHVAPDAESGDLSAPSFAGTKADFKADTQVSGGITYMLTDHLSLDLPLAAPFKSDIVGAGAIANVGKIGEVRSAPATLLLQYRFFPAAAPLRPYLGAGPTYAYFYKARSTAALTALTGGTPANPTTIDVKSKFGFTAQLGLTAAVAPGWSIDATVLKTALKTTATLSTGQTISAKLDPWSYSVGLAYKF